MSQLINETLEFEMTERFKLEIENFFDNTQPVDECESKIEDVSDADLSNLNLILFNHDS